MKNAFGDEIEEMGQPAGAVNAFGDPIEDAPAAPEGGIMSKIGQSAMDYAVKPALTTLGFVGSQIDRVTMGPARAAIQEVQQNREARGGRAEGLGKFMDPEEYKDVGRFAAGFARNFASDPDEMPSPKETMESYGVPSTAVSDVLPSFYSETGEGAALRKGGFLDPTASGTAGMAAAMMAPLPGFGAIKGVAGPVANVTGKAAGKAAQGAAKAVDIATGTKAASKVVDATKTVGKSIAETTEGLKRMFGAKQADDFGESVKTAMKNGIDPHLLPEAVEFGPSSVISRSARVKAEGPLGQPQLEAFERGHRQVQDAVVRDIQNIGGGAPKTRMQAGETLREGYNAGVDRAFQGVEMSHNKILQQMPDLKLTKSQTEKLGKSVNELEAWAKEKMSSGVTNTAKGQGRQILRAIETIKKKGNITQDAHSYSGASQKSYKGMLEALREIGDVAFKSKNSMADIPPDIGKFRKLYGDINEALIGTVDETFDAATAKSLRESNAQMTKIFGDKSLLGEIGEKGTAAEDLFVSLIENGDSKRIAAIKEYLAPEQLQALKGTALNELIKMNTEGGFTFKSLHNAMRTKKDVFSALFEPGELDNLESLVLLGDKFGNPVMSSSGTGASNAFIDLFKTARDRGTDALVTDPLKKKARAVGFNLEEFGGKAAAKPSQRPPAMGFAPGSVAPLPNFRGRSARAYSTMEEDDDE